MSTAYATLVSLSANVVLVIFGAALALLVIWENARRRSNHYFALCMLLFALYGAVNVPLMVAQRFDLSPRPLLQTLTTLYTVGIILVFFFVMSFAGLPPKVRYRVMAASVPLGLIFIIINWTRPFFTGFEPLAHDGYRYRLTTDGQIGGIVAAVYLACIIVVLLRQQNPLARAMATPVTVLVAGVLIFSAIPALRVLSLNAVAVAIAVVMLGRIVLQHQVFQPLTDLNTSLSITNAELYEATRLKSQFLANMSHELRTPLNSIIGYTDLVVNGTYGELTTLQHDRLQKVNRNGRLLLALINDVLDLSKIEAGRLELVRTRIDTAEMLDGLLSKYEAEASEKGLSLVRAYGRLPALNADAGRTRQILDNLLSNAIRYTEQGVVIARAYPDPTRQQVVISIADTGPGIDPAQQERVYHAFRQVDGSLKSEHSGTGLGLAIAYRLVALHGGNLWFESVVGQGTTFHVALPAADQAIMDIAVRPGTQTAGPAILAIDDDREAVEVLQGQLERAGFRVYGACTAADGLRLAHELHPALITLDLNMPDMNGWQVLEALRRDPASAAIPVLIVTAADQPESPPTPLRVDGFITKPVQPDLLIDQVRRLLGTTRSGREEHSA